MALAVAQRHQNIRRLSTAAVLPALDSEIRRLAKLKLFNDIERKLETLKSQKNKAEDADAGVDTSPELRLASLAAAYAAAGMLDHAIKTLDDLPTLGSPRTALSFNAVLSALNHSPRRFGRRRLVPELFVSLPSKLSITPDLVSYGILIKNHCLAGNAKKAIPILREVEAKEMELSAVIYTTVIDSLYKEGKAQDAEKLWKEMESKGIKPDVVAYNVRVMYRAFSGKPQGVLDLTAEMESAGLKPDTVTYNYLMVCYCTHGRVEDAKQVYSSLEEKGCVANYGTYNSLVGALCKAGDFDGANQVFFDSMKCSKVPDLGTVRALVEGLLRVGKTKQAKRGVLGLKKKFPEQFVGEWIKLEKLVGADVEGDKTVAEAA